ncbi:Ger(x)C family spore germination protein [Priestia abyssalis]|uniref:Ger(x)C family spore germination protein n=1 Tax=Priestia abyssalis TaxID=1221450 RepID=UPI001475F177|nr:Ger(x)C family spore germination protein [Priestia abyssalis]
MRHLILLTIIMMLSGCGLGANILDDVDLMQAIAYDMAKDNQIEGTAMIPVYSEQQTGQFDVHAATGHTSKYIRSKASGEAPKPIVSGQLRVALYGEELARKGISDIVDTLYRDASIGNTTQLAVVEGKAAPVVKEKYNPNTNPAMYISNLLEQNIKNENVPKNNLHVFLYKYFSEGGDPYLPLLSRNKSEVRIIGMALFKGDKYIEKISLEEMFVFKMLVEGYKKGTYEFKLEDKNSYAVVENIVAKTDYKFKGKTSKPTLHISIEMDGQIKELTERQNLQEKKAVRKIQADMEKSMEKQGRAMIEKFQEIEIDPFSIGERYKKFNRYSTKEEWKNIYKDLDVDLQVQVHILQSGVVE